MEKVYIIQNRKKSKTCHLLETLGQWGENICLGRKKLGGNVWTQKKRVKVKRKGGMERGDIHEKKKKKEGTLGSSKKGKNQKNGNLWANNMRKLFF